jgi:Domain of unknown function (DUF4873)
MSVYSGPALITAATGEEIEVHANLNSRIDPQGQLESWDGTLSGAADWFVLQEGNQFVRLRIGERDSECIIVDQNSVDPLSPVSVKGSGPAPFE